MHRDVSFNAAIAVVIMVLATIVGLELAAMQVEAPYLVLLPGVMFVAAAGGRLSATIAVLLGAIVTWFYFIPPYWSFALPNYRDAITLLLFIGILVLVSRTYYRQRRTIDELASANTELRDKLLKAGVVDALA